LVTEPLIILSSVKVRLVNPLPLPFNLKVIEPGLIDSLKRARAIDKTQNEEAVVPPKANELFSSL
jgi:hypothetical protein